MNISGQKTSKAFAPLRWCQAKCAFAAPSVNSGFGSSFFHTRYCPFAACVWHGAFTPSQPSRQRNSKPHDQNSANLSHSSSCSEEFWST